MTLELGQPIASNVYVFEQFDTAHDPDLDNAYSALVAGVRWSPLPQRRHRRISPYPSRYLVLGALEFHIGVGAEERIDHQAIAVEDRSSHYALLGQFGLTYLPMQGRDYAWGLELRASASHYRASNESAVGVWLVARLRY